MIQLNRDAGRKRPRRPTAKGNPTAATAAARAAGRGATRKALAAAGYAVDPLEPRVMLATITVNTTDTSALRDAQLSLTEAIRLANGELSFSALTAQEQAQLSGPPASVSNNIHFNIPGGGVHTIGVGTPGLPPLTRPVVIDGYTQPGARPNTLADGNDADLRIRLRHAGADSFETAVPPPDDEEEDEDHIRDLIYPGLVIRGGDSTVRGLILTGFGHFPSIDSITSDGAVWINGGSGNRVVGNFIGVNPDGTADPNTIGVNVNSSRENTIGGAAPADRNVISGNRKGGIKLTSAHANSVLNNYVGTDPQGQRPVANGLSGVSLFESTDNAIGSPDDGNPDTSHFNIISGNAGHGVGIIASSNNNRVLGNVIGTTYNRIPIPNARHGVAINDSSNNRIGSVNPQTDNRAANVIARNREAGVFVGDPSSVGNVIRGNSIFDNTKLGIDLSAGSEADGVTVNDPVPDADPGGNGRQNFPIIASTTREPGGLLRVRGRLNSIPLKRFLIDLYGNLFPDESLHGEGKQYLATITVTTDEQGIADFDVGATGELARVSATATEDGTSNTSEFSPVEEDEESFLEVGSAADSGVATLREQIAVANAIPGPNTLVFKLPGVGPHTINLASALPAITDTLFIDGNSQLGSFRNTNATGPINSQVMVRLAGSMSFPGLTFTAAADDSRVSGLAFSGFQNGIFVNGAEGVTIGGNVIGPVVPGGAGNGVGVLLENTTGASVGTGHPADRNVISGNSQTGVRITGVDSRGNLVLGNLIGTDATGTASGGEQRAGVYVSDGAWFNVIGGPVAAARNVISGNGSHGVFLEADRNHVSGNYIGTNTAGNAPVPNGDGGFDSAGVFSFRAANNVIGGHADGEGNLISGNIGPGVWFTNFGGTGGGNNQVRGNKVGINAAGTAALANADTGFLLETPGNAVLSNHVAGNDGYGIRAVGLASPEKMQSGTISNNIVGTNRAGTAAVGNRFDGISVINAVGLTISGNLIAGNGFNGISVSNSVGLTVSDNVVGTNHDGAAGLGNSETGIHLAGVDQSLLEHNHVGGNRGGIALGVGSDDNTLRRNVVGFVCHVTSPPAGAGGIRPAGDGSNLLDWIRRICGGEDDDTFEITEVPNEDYALQVGGNGNEVIENGFAATRDPDPNSPGSVGVDIFGDDNSLFGNLIGAILAQEANGNGTVEIAAAGNSGPGVVVSGNNNQVGGTGQGNLLLGNGEAAIVLDGGSGNAVVGNIAGPGLPVGTPAALPPGLGNAGPGVLVIEPGPGSVVHRNTIVGSGGAGIDVLFPTFAPSLAFTGLTDDAAASGAAGANLVSITGNFIGTDAAGRTGLGNAGPGVHVRGIPGVVIGGVGPDEGNVIAGNTGPGVWVEDETDPELPTSAFGPHILGNRIGLTAQGTAMGNGGAGVRVRTLGAVVGGTAAGEANVIAHNAGAGVLVESTTVPPPPDADRFEPNDTLQTATDFATPPAAGRTENGLTLHRRGDQDWFRFVAPNPGNVRVTASFVNAAGDVDLTLYDSAGTFLASSNTADNVETISRFVTAGQTYYVQVSGAGFPGDLSPDYDLAIVPPGPPPAADRFEPNDTRATAANLGTLGDRTENDLNVNASANDDYYRLVAAATGPLAVTINFSHALGDLDMQLLSSSGSVLGTSAGSGNSEALTRSVTAGLTYHVRVFGRSGAINPDYDMVIDGPNAAGAAAVTGAGAAAPAGATIRGNSIYSNGGPGIDLGGNGVTPNDAGDADAGANGLQNFPIILTAGGPADARRLEGTFNSRPGAAYRLEFFSSPDADPSGHGEGRTYLGFMDVTTGAAGDATFVFPAGAIAGGHHVTATATDAQGNTSEFGPALRVGAPGVAGRHVYYNHSGFDGNNAAANAADDAAVAQGKQALLPGQAASEANYTSFSKGINGIMVDIAGLPAAALAAGDFTFRVGNDNNPAGWAAAPAPAGIAVRDGAGLSGSDRVSITWANGAIQRQWLQVTVKANANTGLASPDVFYFGNLPGDTFNSAAGQAFTVNSLDVQRTRINQFQQATITSLFDHDRSGNIINSIDVQLARINQFTTLNRITVPGAGSMRAGPTAAAAVPRLTGLFSPMTRATSRDEESR